jgi:hypothetical protein
MDEPTLFLFGFSSVTVFASGGTRQRRLAVASTLEHASAIFGDNLDMLARNLTASKTTILAPSLALARLNKAFEPYLATHESEPGEHRLSLDAQGIIDYSGFSEPRQLTFVAHTRHMRTSPGAASNVEAQEMDLAANASAQAMLSALGDKHAVMMKWNEDTLAMSMLAREALAALAEARSIEDSIHKPAASTTRKPAL